jgi:hypothetical protein
MGWNLPRTCVHHRHMRTWALRVHIRQMHRAFGVLGPVKIAWRIRIEFSIPKKLRATNGSFVTKLYINLFRESGGIHQFHDTRFSKK